MRHLLPGPSYPHLIRTLKLHEGLDILNPAVTQLGRTKTGKVAESSAGLATLSEKLACSKAGPFHHVLV
jgi:hypothetical protein